MRFCRAQRRRADAGRVGHDEVLERLAKFQNADGGWWGIGTLKAPLSTISNTINGLHWLRMVGAEKSALLDRTVAFLKAGQKEGGYWDEPKEILDHDPLMWMVPGKRANQVWYTAALCRYLLESGRQDEVDFAAALTFLRTAWGDKGFPMYPHTHWMALYLFSALPGRGALEQRIVQQSLEIVRDYALQERTNAGEVGEIGYASFKAGPVAREVLSQVLQRIIAGQAEEGYWDFADGDVQDRVVNTTKIVSFLKIAREGGAV